MLLIIIKRFNQKLIPGGEIAGKDDETRIDGDELTVIELLLFILLQLEFSSAWRPSNVELYDLNSVYLGDIIVLATTVFAGSSEVGELKSSDSRDL